ncbi:MAG: hypothetical protein DHS20C15_16170 [Planctomycetota bacterium]|nr:MAG: hypothetical protein DHS20C15_16170 [Planctomycetota bacterium]
MKVVKTAASKSTTGDEVAEPLLARAALIARDTQHELLIQVVAKPGCQLQELNNALMDAYRVHASADAFGLLFELNVKPFTLIAAKLMRMTGCRVDPHDILQEAFLAIYRYPRRFRAEKPNAFRNWSYSILRNTVYRNLTRDARVGIPAELLADVLEDTRAVEPIEASQEAESDAECRRVYALVLSLYNDAYANQLKPRDREALQLVEAQKLGYREAADVLGIKLENFKMVVCRARKRIYQHIVRVLGTRLP